MKKSKALKIAWIVTGFAAIVVLIVYFVKLNDIYREQKEQNENVKLAEADGKQGGEANAGIKQNDAAGAEGKTAGSADPDVRQDGDTGVGGKQGTDSEPDGEQSGNADADTQQGTGVKTDAEQSGAAGDGEKQDSDAAGTGVQQDGEGNPDGKQDDDTDAAEKGNDGQTADDNTGDAADTHDDGTDGNEDAPYHGVDPLKPMVALSFDDGPSIYTERILKLLTEYNGHATFFMVGDNVDRYGDAVRAVYAQGSEIGNHTIAHLDLKKQSKSKILDEVVGNQEKINNALGFEIKSIIRPPYGNYNATVKETCDMPLVLWSVDSEDWKSRDADTVLAMIKKYANDGCIILCHDIYESTAKAVELFVPWLVEQGYQICTVTDMYSSRGEFQRAGHVYSHTMTKEEYISSLEEQQSEEQ